VFVNCAFSSTAAHIWNSVPVTIQTASTFNTFRRHLKPRLFSDNTAIDRLTATTRACDFYFCSDIWRAINADYLLTYLIVGLNVQAQVYSP